MPPGPDLGDDLVVKDYRQVGGRTVTGTVERVPTSDTTKAVLDVSIDLTAEDVAEMSILIEGVPAAVLAAMPILNSFLESEMRLQVDIATDAHVLFQIDAANPPNGATGSDFIAQVRNAISAMHDLGASPNLLVLSGADAAELDLTVQPGTGDYIFTSRAAGSGGPVWNLRVIEVAAMAGKDPYLVDTSLIGAFYAAPAIFLANPYGETNFRKNLVDLRLEGHRLFHVRNPNGAYRLGASS